MNAIGLSHHLGAINSTPGERDVCDRCGARAQTTVLLAQGILTFCRHHGREHATALVAVGARLIDYDNERPSAA